ncbi:MAG: MFS transporter [Halioglobus sp.]
MYFAQGVPRGLLGIALPAWLAAEGVSAGEIASYLAVIILPWAFKLISGPFMDRYQFLAMGTRRPWILSAQLGLTLSLLALMLIDNPAQQMGLLMLLGIVINSFAATQDVAVDGMAIELVPDAEQGRLNAFMSFGKAIGWAATSAVSGVMLVTVGLALTALAASLVAGMVLIVFMFIREREGEKLFPWSAGSAVVKSKANEGFFEVFGGLNSVLWTRTSIIVIAIMFFDGMVAGYGHALMPIAAVKLFGYTTPQWSQLVAVMGLVGALVALASGPFIDRFGAKRMLSLTTALVAAHAFVLAQTQHLWQDTDYVRAMLAIWIMMEPVIMVCVLALAMAICSQQVSATQFAIYMSVANLGSAVGSKSYGLIAESTSYHQSYMYLGALLLATLLIISLYRHSEKLVQQ